MDRDKKERLIRDYLDGDDSALGELYLEARREQGGLSSPEDAFTVVITNRIEEFRRRTLKLLKTQRPTLLAMSGPAAIRQLKTALQTRTAISIGVDAIVISYRNRVIRVNLNADDNGIMMALVTMLNIGIGPGERELSLRQQEEGRRIAEQIVEDADEGYYLTPSGQRSPFRNTVAGRRFA